MKPPMYILRSVAGHQVTRNTTALLVLQVANYIIPFFVLIQLTKVLGVDTYGIVAFSLAIVQFGLVFIDFGFGLAATQKISMIRDNKRFVSHYIGAIFVLKLALYLVVAAAIICFSLLSRKYAGHSTLFLLSLIPLLGQGYQPDWFFSGIERMRFITIFTIMAKILYLFMIYLFVKDSSDYLLVPIANGISQMIATVGGVMMIYKLGYSIALPRKNDLVFAARSASGFFISRLSVTVYTNSNVLLLGLIASPAYAAAYSFAEQLYRVMQSVFTPVIQALYPYMARAKRFDVLKKVAVGCISLALVGAIVGYFAAPTLIKIVFGKSWSNSIPIVNVFLVAIVVNVAASLAGYPLAAAIGNLRVANTSVVCGSLLYLVIVGIMVVVGVRSPAMFAATMIVAELYVLVHRAVVLLPQAARKNDNNAITGGLK